MSRNVQSMAVERQMNFVPAGEEFLQTADRRLEVERLRPTYAHATGAPLERRETSPEHPPYGSGRIAQLVEQLTLNQRVLGSSPSASTIS